MNMSFGIIFICRKYNGK